MMELRNVSYSYDKGTSFECQALKDVSLRIEDGSFLGVTGRAGSGKSTLLRILGSLLRPSSGEVVAEGRVGLVFQFPEHQLFEDTVLKDVMFGPRNLGLDDARGKAVSALELMGLDGSFLERSPFELSGGEQRRVAIAGVLAMQPDVLVLDEPTSGLDKAGHDLLMSILRRLNDEGKTIVLVSHDIDDLVSVCKRMMVLSEGAVVADGDPVSVVIGNGGLWTERFTLVEKLMEVGFNVDHCMDFDALAEAVSNQIS